MPGPTTIHAPSHSAHAHDVPPLDLGPAICADDVESRQHEWLLTNGRGGYACGSVAGVLDRRYHAALAAAVQPPDTRTVILAKFDERLLDFDDDKDTTLTSEVWEDGGLSGFGHRHLVRFRLIDGRTEATWLLGDTRINRQMVMPHGLDMIVAEYTVQASKKPIQLAIKLIGGNRSADFLSVGADWTPRTLHSKDDCVRFELPKTEHGGLKTPLSVRVRGGTFTPASKWYRGYQLDTEARRGYDSVDDHIDFGEVTAHLSEGESLRIEVAAGEAVDDDLRDRDPFAEESARQEKLISSSSIAGEPPIVLELARAADQFVVQRPIPDKKGSAGASIIAGYPWFADWGRDTMISLPGLCLATGRVDVAQEILSTFTRFIDKGMLPNRFPGGGKPPEYNTADASLLFIEAAGRTWRASGEKSFLSEILPGVDEILEAYSAGTRHGIRMDPDDGLITQGAPELQLTWMDARIGNTVVTPRRGKPVEINALWYSAWCWRAEFADALGADSSSYTTQAQRVRTSFGAFKDTSHTYLADVIDGEHGVDYSLRPNQLFATGCAHPPIEGDLALAILEACEKSLLTPIGLRTLPPDDSRYQGHYRGDQAARDAAYHMGTSWPWLLGPYIRTHLNVHNDPSAARALLAPFVKEIVRRGLGSISEVHDGDSPHDPGGCIAQAWSVGELLAAWVETGSKAPWSNPR